MTYDFMKMYVYGNSSGINYLETDIELSLKFGLGEDYYEITKPIYDGWDEDTGRNSFEIDLDWLTSLKAIDISKIQKVLQSDVIVDSGITRKYFFTDQEGVQTGEKITIVGNLL